MVGIIDPLRAEAKAAVHTALGAGIDVRMITGDHAVTAQAIGEQLGLGPGAISGDELRALSDEELTRRLPELHVFGRVSPQDKLRLARTMQAQGLIVAMTGDAVNDAAALKQADIGVAMGSGSEVTKQAARMILTDDNFGTLVHAVEIGRAIYDKIASYVRFQMTQLLALVMLFIAATAFDVNEGVALTPRMVLFLLFFATAMGVVIIAIDPGDPARHAPTTARPIGAARQPIRHRPVGDLRRGAVRRRLRAARRRARQPEHRARERGDDDGVRGDGARHRVQRDHEPPRPGHRPRRPDPQGDRVRLITVALLVLATELPALPDGADDHLAQRLRSGSPRSASRCCCPSWSKDGSGSAAAAPRTGRRARRPDGGRAGPRRMSDRAGRSHR